MTTAVRAGRVRAVTTPRLRSRATPLKALLEDASEAAQVFETELTEEVGE